MAGEQGCASQVTPIRPSMTDGRDYPLDWAFDVLKREGATYLIVVETDDLNIVGHIGTDPQSAALIVERVFSEDTAAGDTRSPIWTNFRSTGERLLRIRGRGRSAPEMLIGFDERRHLLDAGRLEMLGCALSPALARCMALSAVADAERRRANALIRILQQTRAGLVILDSERKICFTNATAQQLLSTSDGIKTLRGTIAASTIASAPVLQAALDYVDNDGRANSGTTAQAVVLKLERTGGGRPLTASIAAISKGEEASEPAFAVYLMHHDDDISELLAPICQLHRLSPVEGRLACYLASGLTLFEASKEMGVRHQTVRSYLRHVFHKTGTNRQADLIRLLITSIAPVDLRHAEAAVA